MRYAHHLLLEERRKWCPQLWKFHLTRILALGKLIILATLEAEVRRMAIPGQSGQKVHKTPS
jgi:hypothetical protein